jgi:hypothetical protein
MEAAVDCSPDTPLEWVVRHGLTGPILPHLPDALADAARRASLLTAVLDRPGSRQDNDAHHVVRELLARPCGRATLPRAFAVPTSSVQVRRWRARVIDRLWRDRKGGGEEFAVNTYDIALASHRDALVEQVNAVLERLPILQVRLNAGGNLDADSETILVEAVSLRRWWGPCVLLQERRGEILQRRRFPYIPQEVFTLWARTTGLDGVLDMRESLRGLTEGR